MKKFRLKAPSPALVVATVALVVAMAGTGYAAFKVGTKNIKNGAVTTKKLHNGAVTTKKLHNGAVTQNKLGSGLSVANANHANSANSANSASAAALASNANSLAGPLASGHTLIGRWATGGTKTAGGFVQEDAITFQLPLGANPTPHFLGVGAAPTAQCPGTAAVPRAASGQLCFYSTEQTNAPSANMVTTKWGARIFPNAATGNYENEGNWAVTG
jgi:hypothetical protein